MTTYVEGSSTGSNALAIVLALTVIAAVVIGIMFFAGSYRPPTAPTIIEHDIKMPSAPSTPSVPTPSN